MATLTATARAQQINAESRETAEREGWVLLGLFEDADFWAERGVHTADHLDHYLACGEHSDAHKEAYGFRPRGMRYDELTTAELRAMISELYETIRCQAEWEAEDRMRESDWTDEPVDHPREDAWRARQTVQDTSPLTHNPFAAVLG